MEPIKMSVSVDVNVDLSQGTKDFLTALFAGHFAESKPVEQKPEAKKPEPKPVEQKPEAKKPEPKPVEQPASKEEQTEESGISIEDVRKALAEKVNDHRAVIKDKLNELGAPSVTKLDPRAYKEMFDFLKSL